MSSTLTFPKSTKSTSIPKATDPLDAILRELVSDARLHPVGSPQRQVAFSEIFRLVMQSNKLWKESSIYYADALQDMWEYCFLQLDDPDDGYQPDVCRVTTWLDNRLKKILRRYRDRSRRQLTRHVSTVQFDDGQVLDPVDSLIAPPTAQSATDMLTQLLVWVIDDPEGILQKRVCPRYPGVNAQVLLQRRLPPGVQSWPDIAKELSADKTYLAQWHSRYCNPLLRDWGRKNGYLS